MEELIKKYEEEIISLNKRLEKDQDQSIEMMLLGKIAALSEVIRDLKELQKI